MTLHRSYVKSGNNLEPQYQAFMLWLSSPRRPPGLEKANASVAGKQN